MSERRRFRDRSPRPAANGNQAVANGNQAVGHGNQPQSRQQPQHHRNGGGGGGGQQRRGGGGRQHNNGQRNGGGGRPEPVAPPLEAGATVEGVLWTPREGSDGVLRDAVNPLRPVPGNVVVPAQVIRDLNLRPGVLIRGVPNGRAMSRPDAIEGGPVDAWRARQALYDLTALDPCPVMKLEHDPAEMTTRVIDILTPIGFGQRGLIVAPPRTGKTMLMQNMARGIKANYPDAELVLLLIDERPEEVTDMRRNVPGTVYASSNDNTVEKHLELSQIVIERCKRQVECGKNVVVLMDSLTRVGRAFNNGGPSGGRTMSGGLDNRALEIPKKLFGAARKVENGGSLTILATCLIDTGSRMDQVIFEEFKGTGNMELTLDRNLSNSRMYPAIDIAASGTRKEEKLLDARQLAAARQIRRHLMNMPPAGAMKSLLDVLAKHKTNQALFDTFKG